MSSDLLTRLSEAERFFKKACDQIVQLNLKLHEMSKRYEKASRENHRSFRYSLRLRMAVTEGVRNMYYEYAATKADEITNLRGELGRTSRSIPLSNSSATLREDDVPDEVDESREIEVDEASNILAPDNNAFSSPNETEIRTIEERDNNQNAMMDIEEPNVIIRSRNAELTLPILTCPDIDNYSRPSELTHHDDNSSQEPCD